MSKKLTFLVLALIVVFSISLMAEPGIMGPRRTVRTMQSARNMSNAVFVADGVNLRTFGPGCGRELVVTPGGNVGLFIARGSGTSSYTGAYFYYSNDFGATWTQSPATGPVIAAESTYTRLYTDIQLGSAGLGYPVYASANIRVGSDATGDTIMFTSDLGGFGSGAWANGIVTTNDSAAGTYKYFPTILVVADSAVFVPVGDIGDSTVYLEASYDYGVTWTETHHFIPADILTLVSNTPKIDTAVGYNAAKMMYIPQTGRLIFLTDVNVNAHITFVDSTGAPYDSVVNGTNAYVYYTSDDMGATWSAPDWVVSGGIPDGFGDWVNGWNWFVWSTGVTSDGKAILARPEYAPGQGWGEIFASVYDGTAWTTTQIQTPAPVDSNYGQWAAWNWGAPNVSVDNAGNAYITWEEITDTTIVNDTVYQHVRIAGTKYDGSVWHTAIIADSSEFPALYTFYKTALNVDDNNNIVGVVDLPSANDANDSAMVFTFPAPTGIATKVSSTIRTMNLAQNMPNPVRGNTTINYSVAKSGHVTLNVYDMSGKLVKTLVNGNVNAGTHSVVWNRTDSRNNKVAGGVYFYKMNANNETLTKKMIVVK